MAILSNGKLIWISGSVKETGQRLESEVKKEVGRFPCSGSLDMDGNFGEYMTGEMETRD